MQRVRAHLTATLVLLHLVAVTLMAIPAPGGGMARSSWKDPTVQAELQAWHQTLSPLLPGVDAAQFEEGLYAFASRYMKARGAVLKPFAPYYRYAGTVQSWRMFVAPHRYPARLRIEVERGGAFETVYLARDAEADWLASHLDHDRWRSAIFRFAWKSYRRHYEAFGRWVADRAREDFPDATRVRLSFDKYRTPSPEEVREDRRPPAERILERTLPLGERP